MIAPVRSEMSNRLLPLRRESIRSYPIDDEAVLYDVAHDAVHYLNAAARFIWERCDGRRTIDEIDDEMARAFDVNDSTMAENDPNALVADIRTTLKNLYENGLLDHNPRMIP
ncbi:MAG: PqqD family protein [Phycisphaerae bacterium]